MKFWTDERDAKLRAMRSQGATLRAIADAVGLSHVSVSRRIHALRLDEVPKRKSVGGHLAAYKQARRGFHVPAHLENEFHKLLKTGVPIVEACRRLGIEHANSSEVHHGR